MAQGLPHTIAAVLFAASVVHCSLTAPSDQDLMGGNKGSGSGGGDAGRSDAMDGSGGSSGSSSGGGQCNHTGDCCNTTSDCCSGLACEPTAGLCIPCTQSGQSCAGGANNMCCSGSCVGHSCQ